ncbi:trans-sulfuration enzyme family protein [Pollutimonas harenae]|uniref:Aminotransferase class I/II-fold pyridoxal phosphate-dependent enzyme n=1 Tax=Pollutimonas harenae TaxID=657015 RepID=A0A853GNB6_9BURK|nr:aminotransferase class I/II-fold pyridoxal phosphate-dependent enzyme [Pollutimonas harenae]NYT84508.1 aminotransferase class I/II-fold pyridoxal phosphate-dependent enzyme [Pollutimonas harenae]TEA73098.1 aminotransferase class I/II-fold pyridoxal phosphate-dependent enzyme [Pollutimonas harenae]
MANSSSVHLDTQLQHAGTAPFDPVLGAAPVALPSMRTSTVRFQNLDALERAQTDKAKGERSVTYGRVGMDTHAALEQIFCDLEGADRAFLASSGLGAITLALFSVLNSGDHVMVADCAYGPVRYLDKTVLGRMNIEVSYSRATVADLADQLRPNTRVLYVESPGSLLFEMLDIPALAAFARQHNLILATDNTWGSGYVYRPLDLGADISVVAGTKYVGGHSDLMLGAVMAKDPDIIRRLNDTHYAMGYSISADDAWLAIRGARTLPIRMRQTAEHALEICRFLAGRAEVARIFHPAWADDPGHALWQRDCTGSNGMLSVELKLDNAAARRFVDSLTLFGIGFSWGGFESLVQLVDHAALRPHGYWQPTDNAIVRLHIGLESPQDLIADMTRALEMAAQG